ncbi:MAG: hypothetical protein K1X65_07580 [Caldilineales bacterium]|nr:hypothetical protein [Caldilineales bacterium]MCW5857746.1 hypothetical protein [Caldilineales bacterium]
MPKQQLTGTLAEQLATVYEIVEQRMAEGKYSGAVHYAQEIIKVDPNYRDIQHVFQQARQARRQQTLTLVASLLVAILGVAIASAAGFDKDWQMLLAGFLGLLLGYLLAIIVFVRRSRP